MPLNIQIDYTSETPSYEVNHHQFMIRDHTMSILYGKISFNPT